MKQMKLWTDTHKLIIILLEWLNVISVATNKMW